MINDNKIKERLKRLLSIEVSDKNKEALLGLGFKEEELDNASLLVATLFEKALKGNASALKFIAFILDEQDEDEQPNRFNDLIKEMKNNSKIKC